SVTATQYFRKLIEEPWGFETKDRLMCSVTVPDRFFPAPLAKQNALEVALRELRSLPGVESATVVSPSPMDAPWTMVPFNAAGWRSARDDRASDGADARAHNISAR